MKKMYLTLEEIQNEEYNILKGITKYLDKNNIKYSLAYGTLIGAIRHKGFIPWDDDIDIVMKRTEYDKLLNLLLKNNKIADDLYGITGELGTSPFPFIKIINSSIAIEQKEQLEKNLWVDIFPLDIVPKNNIFYIFKKKIFFKLFIFKREIDYPKSIFQVGKLNKIMRNILKKILKNESFDSIMLKYIKFCSKYSHKCKKPKKIYYSNLVWGNEKIPSYFLDEYIECEFNGEKFLCIKEYDKLLKITYGDYMKLPPIEERVNHQVKVWKK